MKRCVWPLALLLGTLSAGLLRADPEGEIAKLAKQQRDAARKTYELWWANYRDGRAPGEMLYRWSLRWCEAEKRLSEQQTDQIAALNGHWERMLDLERFTQKLQKSGQVTVDELSATEFYRVEAEVWLLQAKKKKKP